MVFIVHGGLFGFRFMQAYSCWGGRIGVLGRREPAFFIGGVAISKGGSGVALKGGGEGVTSKKKKWAPA